MYSIFRRKCASKTISESISLAISPRRAPFSCSSWPLAVSAEVLEAVKNNKPVVALESAIYTHGFPCPENFALASSLENLIRKHGAVPATVGIVNGIARVGLQPNESVELLEKAGDPKTVKISRRDLGFVLGRSGTYGGTTIAGTLVLAHLAGIEVFATGGLGGVHRDKPGETSMDVSADLNELARTPMALISSGCKSFLDLRRTLEYLETHGVGVGTFADGREGHVQFPAFWTRDSDIQSPMVIKDEKQAAAIIHAQLRLPLSSGLLFANPIPAEHSLPLNMVEQITNQAIEEADKRRITGSANTPFILSRIRQLTDGGTVTSNRILIEANAIRGAKVAVELAQLKSASNVSDESQGFAYFDSYERPRNAIDKLDVVVAGALALDLNCDYSPLGTNNSSPHTPKLHTSNPAVIVKALGGVGNNVATACHYLGAKTALCSVIGPDAAGSTALQSVKLKGMRTDGILQSGTEQRTAQYVAVNDTRKELVVAMADMGIFEADHGGFDTNWTTFLSRNRPRWLVIDANWGPVSMKEWLSIGRKVGSKIALEPVSVEKSRRLIKGLISLIDDTEFQSNDDHIENTQAFKSGVFMIAPNEMELHAMSNEVKVHPWLSYLNEFDSTILMSTIEQHLSTALSLMQTGTALAAIRLLSLSPCVITKLGSRGVLQTELLQCHDSRLKNEKAKHHILKLSCLKKPRTDREMMQASSENRLHGQHFSGAIYLRYFPSAKIQQSQDIRSVNGAGDTFLGALVAMLSTNQSFHPEDVINFAQRAALETLMSTEAVSEELRTIASEVRSTNNYDF